jgi:hypothetical protein
MYYLTHLGFNQNIDQLNSKWLLHKPLTSVNDPSL